MMRTRYPAAAALVIFTCALTVAGCASQRGGRRGGGQDGQLPPAGSDQGRMVPEVQEVPQAREVLPEYVPEKSWEYASMPSPAPERRPSERLDGVSFDHGKSALTREGIAVCRQVARWMHENPSVHVLIVGHSCRNESGNDGVDLARRRAEAARNYLVRDLGVPVNRLEVASFGSRFSKADQSEPFLQQVERRIEFWVM